MKHIATKIAKVMQKVKYIQKTGRNKFHNYNYATEADVNEKVREELSELNVCMIPSMESHSIREHTNRSGNVEYIVAVNMTFTFIDGDTGETLEMKMSGEGQDAGDKGIYKAISGAQKYALMKVFMIPTGDDPESDESVDERNHAPQPQKPTFNKQTAPAKTNTPKPKETPKTVSTEGIDKNKIDALREGLKKVNVTDDYLCKFYKINSLEEISYDKWIKAMEWVANKMAKAEGQ